MSERVFPADISQLPVNTSEGESALTKEAEVTGVHICSPALWEKWMLSFHGAAGLTCTQVALRILKLGNKAPAAVTTVYLLVIDGV